MSRAWRIVVVGLLVAGGLGVRQQTLGAQSAPTLTVEPATDLVDGQYVQVHGSGFPADTTLLVAQCRSNATALDDCSQPVRPRVSPDGSHDASFSVWGILSLTGEVDCRLPDACVMAVFGYDEEAGRPVELARAPLHFDPDGPLAPPPVLAAVPAEDLVDG